MRYIINHPYKIGMLVRLRNKHNFSDIKKGDFALIVEISEDEDYDLLSGISTLDIKDDLSAFVLYFPRVNDTKAWFGVNDIEIVDDLLSIYRS